VSDPLRRNPTTGIAGCCARAASGHVAAAPPSENTNSRRRMWIAMRPSRRRSCACNRETISRFNEGTNNAFYAAKVLNGSCRRWGQFTHSRYPGVPGSPPQTGHRPMPALMSTRPNWQTSSRAENCDLAHNRWFCGGDSLKSTFGEDECNAATPAELRRRDGGCPPAPD
jgi:hypothetical protein